MMQDTADSILHPYQLEFMVFGIDIEFSQEAVEYAARKDLQVSEVLRRLSFSASALDYMGIQSSFHITSEMVQNEKYFDDLFSRWCEGWKNGN